MREFSERYRLYAQSQGMLPEAAMARDDAQWPGAKMLPFIEWSDAMIWQYVDECMAPPTATITRRDRRRYSDYYDVNAWIRAQLEGGQHA